jgi:hypothetical protein
MVTIYTISYNEELMMEFFINHYRGLFPNCEINVYDNQSTDKTVEICKKNNCNVIEYNTNNTLSDSEYLKIKNNCWKTSKTDWVIVCDVDELIEVTMNDLLKEESEGTNCFLFHGYSMMSNDEEIDLKNMCYGFRDLGFDKTFLFNKKLINEINYSPGCHKSQPKSNLGVKFSKKTYRALHYKYLNPKYTVERHSLFGNRLSDENKRKGWGIHYTFTEESIIKYYHEMSKKLKKLI